MNAGGPPPHRRAGGNGSPSGHHGGLRRGCGPQPLLIVWIGLRLDLRIGTRRRKPSEQTVAHAGPARPFSWCSLC